MTALNTRTKSTLGGAAILMLLTRMLVNSLGIISSLVLVRLLTPEDFGVAAIAMAVFAFIGLFGEFGFNTALIQKSNPVKSDYDTVFTANVIFGVIASISLFIGAKTLASFFENSSLVTVFQVLSLLFLINGLKNVKAVDFQINMDFKREMKLQVVPKLISFFATLLLAITLESYWALIFGSVLFSGFTVIFSYLMIPYRPSLSIAGISELFNYSKWLMLNNLFFYLNNKSIDLIVGKFISTSAAGIYSMSKEMALLPATEVAAPINKASFPAYSRNKHSKVELCNLFYQTSAMISIIALPSSAGLFIVADYFVPVVLGQDWVAAIPVIQYLSVFAFISALFANNGYIFLAIGKPKVTTLLSGLRIAAFFFFLFFFGLFEATEDPAKALVLSAIVNFILSYAMLKMEIGISYLSILRSVGRTITSSVLMVIILYYLKIHLALSVDLLGLVLLILVGVFCYFASLMVQWVLVRKPDGIESNVISSVQNKLGIKHG